MEAEEQKNDPEEETKAPKRVKLTVTKVKEISSRMLESVVEEQKAVDTRRVIRAIKDPSSVIKGTKPQTLKADEGAGNLSGRKSALERNKESMHSLYKLPGTDIKLSAAQAESIGFLECMSSPRIPNFDETESDTTFERLSNDSESEETPSLLELLKSDQEEDKPDEQTEKTRKGCKTALQIAKEEYEKEDDIKPISKKPKLKKWKPRVKRKGMSPDPLLTEFADGVTNYLSEIGIFQFMKDWLMHLYGMNPKPKDPVKLLLKYLEDSLGNSESETGVSNLDKELKMTLKKEDDIIVETSKLNHLAHLLAPEIYDAEGNMISHEPSVEEEQIVVEEESAITPSVEFVDINAGGSKVRKGSAKSRSGAKKVKSKQSTDINRVPSRTVKTKLKKKKSVAKDSIGAES